MSLLIIWHVGLISSFRLLISGCIDPCNRFWEDNNHFSSCAVFKIVRTRLFSIFFVLSVNVVLSGEDWERYKNFDQEHVFCFSVIIP